MGKNSGRFARAKMEALQRAIATATERRHDAVGLEHLLLAATDEPQARRILISCGADVETLRRQVTEVLTKAFEPVPGSSKVQPEPTIGFDRVVQQAVMH